MTRKEAWKTIRHYLTYFIWANIFLLMFNDSFTKVFGFAIGIVLGFTVLLFSIYSLVSIFWEAPNLVKAIYVIKEKRKVEEVMIGKLIPVIEKYDQMNLIDSRELLLEIRDMTGEETIEEANAILFKCLEYMEWGESYEQEI